MAHHSIYTTAQGVKILATQGIKSQHDFIVRYIEPRKRRRTPKHIHIIIDLYMKLIGNMPLTMQFIDHVITNIIANAIPNTSMPPQLQIYNPAQLSTFNTLNQYGEYSVEFLLVVIELIMIQEKTNYPNGHLNLDLFTKFRNNADIFSVVSAATFR